VQDILSEVRGEIAALHDVLVSWFRGTIAEAALDADFGARLHADFEQVQPLGQVLSRAELLRALRPLRGSNPDFAVEIREVRLLGLWPQPGLVLAGYVEDQFAARNTIPADNRRRCTCMLERGPGSFLWRHVHETGVAG
jgi:hypothetical protein